MVFKSCVAEDECTIIRDADGYNREYFQFRPVRTRIAAGTTAVIEAGLVIYGATICTLLAISDYMYISLGLAQNRQYFSPFVGKDSLAVEFTKTEYITTTFVGATSFIIGFSGNFIDLINPKTYLDLADTQELLNSDFVKNNDFISIEFKTIKKLKKNVKSFSMVLKGIEQNREEFDGIDDDIDYRFAP